MIKRWLGQYANSVLRPLGLRLDYIEHDFDDRPLDEFSRHKLFSAMGRQFDEWVRHQSIFPSLDLFDASEAVEVFFEEWLRTPFREQQGGSRFNNLLWLFLIAKAYRPTLVVDSGTYQGASAWALSLGSPGVPAYSFDIDLSRLALRCSAVKYVEDDWTKHMGKLPSAGRALIYFDDHVDQIRRLIEAGERGYQVGIFDDDYPLTSFFSMAPSGRVLPKIEFALDAELEDGRTIEWLYRGQKQTWTVDAAYLQRGRGFIARTERLPNTSLISGIHQTPYRIVMLQSGST